MGHSSGPAAPVAMVAGVIGMVIGLLLGLTYPILLLIFMTRPKVVAAFGPEEIPPVPVT